MKSIYKFLIIFFILCFAGALSLIPINDREVSVNDRELNNPNETKEKLNKIPVREQKKDETGLPIKIIIDGIDAPIYPVGLTESGAMDTVDGAEAIAWYQYGSVPGEEGNALLAGHRDWNDDLGTFYNLETLQKGTEITIEFSNGSKKRLTLQKTEIYDKDHVPTDVMRIDGEERTTLITCTGQYIKEQGTYQDRVISIFKEKKE